MKLKSIIAILIMIVAGLQSVKAQKIILHMPDNQKVEYEISQLDSITFIDAEQLPAFLTCPDDHHPHAIDLGLSSGTKWCCCNVGASTPEGYGGYYAWGETSEKSEYNWSTYKYCKGSYDTMTKYCTNSSYGYNGFTDGKTELDPADDAATVNMGAPWRMPSHDQQMELMNNCTRQWTTQNGVNGILVTGPSGGQIFLPAAGYRWSGGLYGAGSGGYYWSSSLGPDGGDDACHLLFSSGGWGWSYYYNRNNVFSVRPVCP